MSWYLMTLSKSGPRESSEQRRAVAKSVSSMGCSNCSVMRELEPDVSACFVQILPPRGVCNEQHSLVHVVVRAGTVFSSFSSLIDFYLLCGPLGLFRSAPWFGPSSSFTWTMAVTLQGEVYPSQESTFASSCCALLESLFSKTQILSMNSPASKPSMAP